MVNLTLEGVCKDDQPHSPGFSDFRIYCNGYEIPVSHCSKCNIQIPSDEQIKALESRYASQLPGEFGSEEIIDCQNTS